jgi:predicted  nucleic acid-binding Zn-ribbon protein
MVTLPKRILLSLVVSSSLISPALYAKSETNLVQSIMELRSDVESLYTQIDDNKEAYRTQMKSYALQISDNEAQINRQETALKLTQQSIEKAEKKLEMLGSATVDLKPVVNEALAALEKEIKSGIPFKVEERVVGLHQIKDDLKNGNISQEKALALTWASYDDALRLTKEIGQFKQEITLDGKETMAKIAKMGSVMMFFATPDDRVGYVKQDGKKYSYVVAKDSTERDQIIDLFDSLQKQIRTGYFTLPNALLLRGAN